MPAISAPLTLRLMTERDLPMLHDWLNRPHIVEWWGGEDERPSLDDVRQHYLPRVLAQTSVTPYIAMQGGEPMGYAQSYVAVGSGEGWWEEETDPAPGNLRAIRCYEKAGFVQQGLITTPDGPAVYMVQSRQIHERAGLSPLIGPRER